MLVLLIARYVSNLINEHYYVLQLDFGLSNRSDFFRIGGSKSGVSRTNTFGVLATSVLKSSEAVDFCLLIDFRFCLHKRIAWRFRRKLMAE